MNIFFEMLNKKYPHHRHLFNACAFHRNTMSNETVCIAISLFLLSTVKHYYTFICVCAFAYHTTVTARINRRF